MTVDIFGPGPRTVTATKTAGMNLSGHRVVRPGPAGTLVYADPLDTATYANGPWYLTQGAIAVGAEAAVLGEGEITEPSWTWSPGQRLFLGTNGTLSTTPPLAPARMVIVAVASKVDTIYFDPGSPIETT